MRLWLLTNGLGEDRAAALIATELGRRRDDLHVVGAALITGGEELAARGVPVLLSGPPPASGGFPLANLRALVKDLPAVPRYYAFVRRLHRLVQCDDEFLSVGDVFLTGLARLAFNRAGIHVALAKSTHGRPHSRLEHRLMRRWTRLVFTRDGATAVDLKKHRVRAIFVGNPLFDGLRPSSPGATDQGHEVLLLAGSRREAPANFVRLLDVARAVDEPVRWTCAWAAAVPVEAGVRAAIAAGWKVANEQAARENRVTLCNGTTPARCVTLVTAGFESLLAAADLVVGLAGSANEQAAAVGKPVVTLVGCGPQTTAARMAEQERLLGGAAEFVPGTAKDVAAAVSRLLRSPEERARRGCLGIARLGPAGGAARIADAVIAELGL